LRSAELHGDIIQSLDDQNARSDSHRSGGKECKRSFEFYREVFGVIKVYDENGWIQAQTPGAHDILVFDESAPRPGKAGGVAQFGCRLIDPKEIDAAATAVREAGGKILDKDEFCPGEPYLFFKDLDGMKSRSHLNCRRQWIPSPR
jgi:predicted enzyme related to lactoylglutathione lyase